MANDDSIPQIKFELLDYTGETSPLIPESYSDVHTSEATAGSSEELLAKVRRKIIRGRIDGN